MSELQVSAPGEPVPGDMGAGGQSPALRAHGLGVGVLLGVATMAVVGAGWYAVVVGTKSSVLYLAVAMAFAVSYVLQVVTHRHGAVVAVIAVAITAVGLVVWLYAVDRYLQVRKGYVVLPDKPIPVWPSFRVLRDVLRNGFREAPSQWVFAAVALAAAGWTGMRRMETTTRFKRH